MIELEKPTNSSGTEECCSGKNSRAKFEYWLNIFIALVTGLLTGIITSSIYEKNKLPAYIGLIIVAIIAIVTISFYIRNPELLRRYSSIWSTGVVGGVGAGLVIGIGTTALYKGDYSSFGAVILVIIAVLVVTIIYRSLAQPR